MRKPLLLNLFFAFFLAPLSMEGQTINEAIDNEDLSISLSGDADWEGQTQESWDGEDAARSGDITDDQTSKMETTVYGPGTLSFYWKVSSESYYDQLQFQVDGMVEDNISGLTDWTLVEYSVPEGEHTISWEYTKDGSVSDNEDCGWIDMVTYDGPSCYAGEINLEDFTSDQALLSWNTGGDMVDTWHVEWGESGFVQGEGNQATVNEESYWIEGLNENSYYDFYVQPVCSEEDGIWAGPFSFNILEGDNCDNAIDLSTLTLPYRDNTSSYNNDFNNWYSASSKDMVFYRDVEDQAAIDVMLSSDFFETVLELSVGQDCPGEEGVFSDFGNNVKGSWFNDSGETKRLWIVVSGYDGEEGSFSLDEEYYEPGTCLTPGNVQSSGLTDRSAQIDWDPFGKADVWEVLYGPEGFDPESEGESMLASQTSVELTDLTPDQDYDVYVRSACGSDNFSEFSGKINFQTYPTCRVPSGLFVGSKTQTGAQLDWYSPQEITEWEIEYGPYGFTQGEGTTITDITESNYSLEGLEPSTIYEVYVRSNCGEDGYSDWSRGYVFSTECGGGGVGLPFEEDFDDLYLYDFNRLLPCWELHQDPDSESQVYTYYTDYMEYSGGQNLLLRAYAGSAAYLSFPEIGVDINQLMLRFKGLAPNSEPGFLEIGTMASPEDGSSFVSVKEIDLLDLGSEWNDIAMLFEEIPETHNYIALKIISPADNSLSFAMDEVEIDEVSGSPAPGNLRVDEIKDSSSFISWDEFGAASEWEVSIGQPGFDPEEEGTSFSTENNAFELVDLEPETYYDFYVRSIGPDGNTSEWTGPTSFITEEKCPAPENLNIEEVSETSAELSWDETGDAALWNIEWGDFGFEEGEGTLVEDLTETSYLFEDLNKNTWYQFNVSSNCEEDGGSDIISGTYSAGCDGNMAEIPYSTDFTNTPGSQMPVCWLAPSEETTNYDQVVEVEEYNASLLMMNYGNAFTDVDNSVFAALPELNATLTDLSVSFSAFKSSWLNGDVILQVGVYTPAGEFIPHEEFLIDQTNSDHLTEHVVYFDDYSGDTDGRIAFYLADKESNQHRVNIDQVTVEEIPVCRKPSRLTIDAIAYDEVELTWQENGDAQKWEVVYGPEGFDPDEEGETLMPEETSFAVLSGLEANTDYEVYVRSECSDGGFSDWSMPGGFTSWCQPLQVQLTNVDEGGQVNVTDEFELLCDVSFSCVDKNVQVYLENTDTGEEYKIDDLSEEDYENELSCTLNNFIPSGNYRVRFEYNEFSWNDDHDVREVYTHEFEIVNGKEKLLSLESPQSGAILYYEYEMLIRWNSLGVEKVRIEYTLDNGETWSTYQEIESSGGYSKGGHNSIYRKAAREMVGESVKIRLSDVSNPEINVESGSFSVVRNMPFSLISPSEEMMEVSREEGFEMVFEMTVPGSVFYYPVTEEEDLTENRVKIDASEGENTYLVETADLPDGVYSLFIHGLDQQWNYDDFPDFEIVTDTSIDWFKDDGRDNEIMVYPNPVKNQLFLSAEKAGSEIPAVLYDMSGRAVREGFVNGRPINMTGMKPGVYFLVINGETHKIVKE